MKTLLHKKSFLAVLMFLAVSALSVVSSHAQMETIGVKAEIPNTFIAGETQLPAGNYTIAPVSILNPGLELKDAGNKVSVFLLAEDAQPAMNRQASEIVFDKIGKSDFLREVRTEDHVYRLEKSRREMALEKQGLKSVSHSMNCMPAKGHPSKSAKAMSY